MQTQYQVLTSCIKKQTKCQVCACSTKIKLCRGGINDKVQVITVCICSNTKKKFTFTAYHQRVSSFYYHIPNNTTLTYLFCILIESYKLYIYSYMYISIHNSHKNMRRGHTLVPTTLLYLF